MKKLCNARSPFWQLLLYGVFFCAALLIAQRSEIHDPNELHLNRTLTFIAALCLTIIGALYTLAIVRHNRAHPKHKIRYLGLLPPELKEEDEGMRVFTARATRRVYVYHATFLPIFAIAYAYLLPPPSLVIAGLAVLILGHFLIYLVTIWPVLGED